MACSCAVQRAGFSYLHALPPQAMEQATCPGRTFRNRSPTFVYLGVGRPEPPRTDKEREVTAAPPARPRPAGPCPFLQEPLSATECTGHRHAEEHTVSAGRWARLQNYIFGGKAETGPSLCLLSHTRGNAWKTQTAQLAVRA